MTVFNLNSTSDANKTENTANQIDDTSTQFKQKKLENQKIGLIKYLIYIEDWETSLALLEKLPQWYLATYEDVSQSICKALHKIIDPIYSKFNCFSIELKKKYFNYSVNEIIDESIFKNFNNVALPILRAIGPGVYNDTILFTKLIRICTAFIDYVNYYLFKFRKKNNFLFFLRDKVLKHRSEL